MLIEDLDMSTFLAWPRSLLLVEPRSSSWLETYIEANDPKEETRFLCMLEDNQVAKLVVVSIVGCKRHKVKCNSQKNIINFFLKKVKQHNQDRLDSPKM